MRNVTAAGRNVDEAVQSGLQELGLTKDKVEITVIEEGSYMISHCLFAFLNSHIRLPGNGFGDRLKI